MKISIFTPTHNAAFLEESYRALRDQELRDGDSWEWIVLLNNGAKWLGVADERVLLFVDETGIKDVGYLKRAACGEATGDVLLELDHDDLLLPGALKAVGEAFADDGVDFVYSNAVSTDTRNGQPLVWDARFGWRYRPYAGGNQEAISPVAIVASTRLLSEGLFALLLTGALLLLVGWLMQAKPWRVPVAGVLMGLACLLVLRATPSRALHILAGVPLGAAVYYAAASTLRVPELAETRDTVMRKFRRKAPELS